MEWHPVVFGKDYKYLKKIKMTETQNGFSV